MFWPSFNSLFLDLIDSATSQSKPNCTFESKDVNGRSFFLKESGKMTFEIELFSKAPSEIDSIESGTAKSEREFPAKALIPISVRDSGKLNCSILLLEKAPSSILTTEPGRLIS